MLSNKSKGERRKMFMLLWLILGFLYYHIRITGGVGTDLINTIIVSEPGNDLIFEEESFKALIPYRQKLADELVTLQEDTTNDKQQAQDYISEGGTQANLDLVIQKANGIEEELVIVRQAYDGTMDLLIDKSDTSTAETQLLSTISQLAAQTGIEIVKTTPVTSFRQTDLYNASTNKISSIPEGKQAVAGSPVLTDDQAAHILESELFRCRQYEFTGSPVLFYVFLKQLEALEQDVFLLDVSISKSKPQADEQALISFSTLLVY